MLFYLVGLHFFPYFLRKVGFPSRVEEPCQPLCSQSHGLSLEWPSPRSVPQTSDKTILYSVATTLVNCTNSYDVKEVIPELVQLAKFSKQHVPEEHPKVGMGEGRDRCLCLLQKRWGGKNSDPGYGMGALGVM